MLEISKIIPTQNGIRSLSQVKNMISFINKEGIFDIKIISKFSKYNPNLVQINYFEEDDKYFLHDGHHRVSAILLGKRDFLYDREYNVTKWKYSEYSEICLDKKWYTPFDPNVEERVSNFYSFKDIVERLKNSINHTDVIRFIQMNKDLYCVPKTNFTMLDFVRKIDFNK